MAMAEGISATDMTPEIETRCTSTQEEDVSQGYPRSAEGALVVVGNVKGESLQERFLRFKKERQRERALTKRSACRPINVRDVEQLRRRFVEVCRGYLGVPYARRCHDPDEDDFNAPLFLDCCGLVRRAVQDLQEDFGFKIGKWNQAYQFETLPNEIPFEEAKPGDLVFVEGTYFDEHRRAQRHNIVHVEVFIGADSGEATIGSRWSRSSSAEGKVRGVQIHDSYKYSSKNYEIHRFIFRSLDTWLHGVCKSQSYPDAVSSQASVECGGKSIFQEEQDESGNEDEHGGFVPDPYRESPVFYVGEGNNWKVIAETLEARGWRRLPFEAGFSSRFDLKWVEQRAKIDYRRHLPGQLVNHIPNNDVITSKARFLDTMRAHTEATGVNFPYHPVSFATERGSAEKLAALAAAEQDPLAAWALKPSRGLGGSGIEILRGPAALRERLFPPPRDLALEPAASRSQPTEGWVVQKYIENPLLLAGRKFDMRAYCIVARTTPHLWFFRPGYCKVALEPYNAEDLADRLSHLTNACVQKTHPAYRESLRGQHIWSEEEAEAEFIASGRHSGEKGTFWPGIHEQMKRALATVFEASSSLLERRAGYFDLLGVDFMLDDQLGLHLLEMNSNPAIWFDSSATLRALVPDLIATTLDLVLEAQKPSGSEHGSHTEAGATLPIRPPLELLVDEASGFVYGKS